MAANSEGAVVRTGGAFIFVANVKFTGRDESVDKRLMIQSCRTVAKPDYSATSGRVQRLVEQSRYRGEVVLTGLKD